MRRTGSSAAFLLLCALVPAGAGAETFRFPQPDFTSGYVRPVTATPLPDPAWLAWADVVALALALGLAAWLALRARSRRGLLLLSVLSVLYFGFYRLGCVCPVGSVQNVVLGLFDPAYAAPLVVVLFFALPLLASLLFGRVFCAAVCPLGALQDLFVWKPARLPAWLTAALGLLPYVYLGLAVLFAATGAGFVVCRYDPFVGFFRLGGPAAMLATGGALLLAGLFVARPYCRFLCPYGVLLGWTSRLARRHLTITPDECVRCRLCETACPFEAILPATEPGLPEDRPVARRRFARLLALVPLLTAAGALAGWLVNRPLARQHPAVLLDEQVAFEEAGLAPRTTLRSEAFRATGRPAADLRAEADGRRAAFAWGGPLLGAFAGAAAGVRLAGAATYRRRRDYLPDRARCLSCGRCFASCPREHARLERREGPLPPW